MTDELDIEQLKKIKKEEGQYEKRIAQLEAGNPPLYTESIKETVKKSIKNLDEGHRSFIIYGDPQSGKTEMMIALTAKLLDKGYPIIILLVTDNVLLLNQNLKRFRGSGINPSAKSFDEILDSSIKIENNQWVIFSKKNPKDLEKVIKILGPHKKKLIIDDEADYATPNSRVQIEEKSKINQLIEKLRGEDGIYIGVTATPARLDINNTLQNKNDQWVYFPPHPKYTGPDTFFPITKDSLPYTLTPLSDDNESNLRDALFRFCINIAFLNKFKNEKEKNYCMLIHTSGKIIDHTRDYQLVLKTIVSLSNTSDTNFDNYYNLIFKKANEIYPGKGKDIATYIVQNINKYQVITLNSKRDLSTSRSEGTPIVPFTIIIGGNIISRGMTFDNLLSMFFTRNVKNVFNQDVYIQRARMFGARGEYLNSFELIIPEELYKDWHQCFIFHRLSLEPIKLGGIPPVWIYGGRIFPTARKSIDKKTVIVDSGEMKFEIFKYNKKIDNLIKKDISPLDKIKEIKKILGNALPSFILEYILKIINQDNDLLAIHSSADISGWADVDKKLIIRPRNFITLNAGIKKKFPRAEHHIQIVYNSKNRRARLIYKPMNELGFMRNLKK